MSSVSILAQAPFRLKVGLTPHPLPSGVRRAICFRRSWQGLRPFGSPIASVAMDLLADVLAQEAATEAWPGLAAAESPPALPAPRNVAQALARIPVPLRDALTAAGATAPGTLKGLCDGSQGDAEKTVDSLLPGLAAEERAVAVASLLWVVEIAKPEAAASRRRYAHMEAGEIIQEVLEGAVAKRARAEQEAVELEVRGAESVWKPAVRPARFRLRTDARVAAAAGPAARADAEQLERSRWKEALVGLIREAGGPIVEATRCAAAPDAALAAAAGGRRARTLAKRIGAWRRVRAWCMDLYSAPFPRTVMHLVEYLQARADEPCGLSVLEGVAAGFTFMEDCCGFARGRRLVDDPLFAAYYKELAAGYSGAGAGPLRQAPRYPLAIVLALEREVVDEGVATCYRCHAWWHLLSLWASLRFDDHRGLRPGDAHLTIRGLEAVLCRTKTTGPGKRVTSLPLVVGYGSYLRESSWLVTGWNLWQASAPFVRDFFLVKPAPNLDAMLPTELTYEQSSRLSRAVLSGLPREDDIMPVLGEPIVGLFTQHSARCWLSSMAALLQVPEADLAYLGRWSPTAASGYVRTATEVVMKVQSTVARRLRRDFGGPVDAMIGEQAAYLEMRKELLRRNFGEQVIDDQLDLLQAWTGQLAVSVVGESVGPDPVGIMHGVLEVCAPEEEELSMEEPGPSEKRSAAPPTPPVDPVAAGSEPLVLPVREDPSAPPVSGFVVSLSKSDWRRLHRIGGCARHPGVHYLRFEWLGDERPKPEEYGDFCRQCWKTGGPDEGTDDEDSETDPEEEEAPLLVDEPNSLDAPVNLVGF